VRSIARATTTKDNDDAREGEGDDDDDDAPKGDDNDRRENGGYGHFASVDVVKITRTYSTSFNHAPGAR
jgi:hypothetical protein